MVALLNDFNHCRELLLERLREPAPARSQLLTGPRQVGKTTLLLEIARQFGYAAGDEPDAALPGFWERGTAILLLDEIHHLSDWAKRMKGYWDRQHRRRAPIHVVATGSSALRVSTGSRESLAGRFERMVRSTLSWNQI